MIEKSERLRRVVEEVRARIRSNLIISFAVLTEAVRLVDKCSMCDERRCIVLNQYIDGRLEFMCKTCKGRWPWRYQEKLWGIEEEKPPACDIAAHRRGCKG